MKRTTIIIAFIFAALCGGWAKAGPFQKADWEISLSGSGGTPSGGDSFNAVANVGLGYFLTDAIELGIRQGIGYSDVTDNHWFGSSTFFGDYNLALNDKFVIFAGGLGNVTYGDGQVAAWSAGPEAGIKYFVTPSTIIGFSVAYTWDINQTGDNNSGQFLYNLALSFKI